MAKFDKFDIAQSIGACAYIFGDRVEPAPCYNKFPCGVCKIPPGKLLKIKGLCTVDIEANYDTDYYVYGTKNGFPHFRYSTCGLAQKKNCVFLRGLLCDCTPLHRGAKISHIFFNDKTEKWTLQSLKDPTKFVQTGKFPIGTSVWEIIDEGGLCGLKSNSTKELTMSLCYPNKYTCNSGDCIPLRYYIIFSREHGVLRRL
jgi:hypothetical protein